MSQIVAVDLSAKVEQWNKNSVIAFSNGIQGSTFVSKKVKKASKDLLKIYYPHHGPAFYTFQLFAVFIYLTIQPYLQQIKKLHIDQDYSGKKTEGFIKDFLLNFLRRDIPSLRGNFIQFRKVGGSNADRLARDIYQDKKKADRSITFKQVQALWSK